MIFYFDFGTYFRLLRLALHEAPANRRPLLFRLLVRVPLVAIFHAICFFLDGILFPALHRVEVRSPVFIVGHGRSGTTLLHRLMSADGERFSFFMFYELWFPSILQKKVIRLIAACDRRFLGSRIARRVKAWEERAFGPMRHIHNFALTAPEEDDFVLTDSCASGWWTFLLPYIGQVDFYYIDQRPPRQRQRLMRYYRNCIRRQLYLNGPDKIHLSKNPTFCGRVETLIEHFPDARFVVPLRNPNETIPSLLKMLQVSWSGRGWSTERMQQSLRVLAQQSFHTYTYPLQVLRRHPDTKHAIVDYAELVREPKRVVEEVYAQLGFPVTQKFAATLEREQRRATTHESTFTYSLEEFGLEPNAIRNALSDLFDRYGWDAETHPEAAGH